MYTGMGWVPQAATFAYALGSRLWGSPAPGRSVADYYPAVKRGELLCPGPFSIPQVAASLSVASPQVRSQADALLATDGAWTSANFGPLTTWEEKASALVNWAHGGRDCNVAGGVEPQVRALVESLSQGGGGAYSPIPSTGGGGVPTAAPPLAASAIPSWAPMAAVAVLAILAGRKKR